MKKTKHLPPELMTIIQDIYEPAGLQVTVSAKCENEGAGYGACRLGLNGFNVAFRIAKITPKKLGQFVTVWKRPTPNDPIIPLDTSDDLDFVIVSAIDGANRGQFIFDQKILVNQGIMSHRGKGGKLAFRVYPPWTKPEAKAAIKTQQWQLQYFFLHTPDEIA